MLQVLLSMSQVDDKQTDSVSLKLVQANILNQQLLIEMTYQF